VIAAIDLFCFGLGFGRVLQLVHARSRGLDMRQAGGRRSGPLLRAARRAVGPDPSVRRPDEGTSGRTFLDRPGSRRRLAVRAGGVLRLGRRGSCSTTRSPRRRSCPAPCSRCWASSV
jgi:hypothetical protein